MPATDAFIGPQPLHRIPTPQSASQNVSKIVDQFQYPPCVLRASQKHTYRSLSVVQLAGRSPISSACLYVQTKTEYNVSTKILVPRNQPSKEKSEAKNGFNFGYTFWRQFKYRQEGREAKTEAKNGFEKASPIPAAMGHGTWRFHTIRRWRVFTSVATDFTNQQRGCNSRPKIFPNPTGHKDLSTHCVLRASQKHTYRSLSVVQLAGRSPISSACLYVQTKTEYNVSTKILVPRNQPSKEKSEAKNGFNFGYTFWRQFKYRQEGREAKTEAKNGFEKASPIPAAMGHGTWRFHTIRRWRVFTSVATDFTNQQRGCNSRPKIFPNPTGHKDLSTHWGGPWTGLCFHGTFAKLLFASSMWQSAGFGQLAD